MSDFRETRLSETDKLLKKVEFIYKELSGEQDIDVTRGVKDKFEVKKFQINSKLRDIETELSKKEEITGTGPKDIMTRKNYEIKIDDGLREVADNLKELEIIFKKEGKKDQNKEKTKNLLQQTYELLVKRNMGENIQEELKTNMNQIKQLDELLLERQQEPPTENRELYQEEKDKMNEWNNRVGDQDRKLDVIGIGVKELGVKARKIGEQTDQMGKIINDVQKDADKVQKNLETTNAKLKNLLKNLRSGDKICIDIILILICLGLIAVLYNLIQTKFMKNSSSSTNTNTSGTTTTTRFLMIM